MEFRDLKAQYQALKPEIDKAISGVISRSSFIMGGEVPELEQLLADFIGVKHCVACANGTDALEMALASWPIQEGDAVFVPDFTFFSTAEVVVHRKATPVFVDIDENTFNMDPRSLKQAIEKTLRENRLKPKAIIAVDLFGQTANFTEIQKIADQYRLLLLEDGAQGFGGSLNSRNACGFGNAGTTSFFPAKPLGCYGDGGAVFTNDDQLDENIRSLRIHGKGHDKYDNVRIGFNSRLDTLQAAILIPKFKAFQKYELAEVNRAAKTYTEHLNGIVKVPEIPEGYYSSWAQYSICLESREQRDSIKETLKQAGIPTNIYYPKPLHKQTAFQFLGYRDTDLPVAIAVCDKILALPMHPYLRDETIVFICDKIKQALAGK